MAVALAACLLAGWGTGCGRDHASDDPKGARPTVKARVVSVVSRDLKRSVEAVGTLFPFEEVTVSSEVEGRVDTVYVDVGDPVARGRTLVKILPIELDLSLEQQKAALRQIQARLVPSQGEGELKDPRDAAPVRKAEADRTDAQQKYERAKELADKGLIAPGTFDEAEAKYNGARAAYDMAVQDVQNLQAQAAQRSAMVAMAEKKLGDSLVKAPFAGRVKERMVSPGQYVLVQSPVMVIVDNDPLRVRLKVPEKMAGWVAVGQPVTVQVEAYPGRTFQGKIARINPSVEPQTRSFDVEALLDNADGSLKPGFFARASIVTGHADPVLLVPQAALRYVYGVYKIYVVEGGTLKETEIKLGARSGDDVEVASGLKDGAAVAVPMEGQELRDGALVEPP